MLKTTECTKCTILRAIMWEFNTSPMLSNEVYSKCKSKSVLSFILDFVLLPDNLCTQKIFI